ncbi:DUF6529 family protein [Actinacidiphila sp. bgisy144]|uniref:DUF6529 family protein n=1 Tax=Actinacidiphila sp. bgisy144 TaxID=3413791 RepID=UPI003EBED2BF
MVRRERPGQAGHELSGQAGEPGGRRHGPGARAALAVLAGLAPFAVGAGLYVFGREHTPDYTSGLYGQHGIDAIDLKARLGSALFCLVLLQYGIALWMTGRIPRVPAAPARVRTGHRVLGYLLFLFSLPIAYHCLVTYGIETTSARAALHSFAGCVFYGAFVAKVIVVRSRRLPGVLLPAVGSLLLVTAALLWYTASLWVLGGYTVPGFSSVFPPG